MVSSSWFQGLQKAPLATVDFTVDVAVLTDAALCGGADALTLHSGRVVARER